MKAELVVRSRGSRGKVLTVPNGAQVLVGRGANVGFHLREEGVSRNHCALENRGQRLIVTDLGSTNGTCINNTPVLSGYLHHGDTLRLGLAVLEVAEASVLGHQIVA